MSTEDRVKVLEGEFKLIKSELRQTLGSVRDFMLDLKLPPVQENANKDSMDLSATTAQNSGKKEEQDQGNSGDDYGNGYGNGNDNAGSGSGGGGGGGSRGDMGDNSAFPEPSPDFSSEKPAEPSSQGASAERGEPMSEMEEPLDFIDEDNDEGNGVSSGEMPGQPRNNQEQANQGAAEPVKLAESKPTTPPVNLLANLIRWVAVAKRDIGMAQLPVFLDVYASSGNLNTEMKDIILHLAEVAAGPQDNLLPEKKRTVSEQLMICMEINGLSGQLPDDIKQKIQRLTQIVLEQSVNAGQADNWSQLLLELHGVLSGFGNCVKPFQILQSEALAAEAETDSEETEDETESHMDLGDEDDESELAESDEDVLCVEDSRFQNVNGTKPAKLRLIMPVGDGTEQELDLGNLFIATDKIVKQSKPEIKSNISKKKVVSRGKAWRL